MDNLFIKYIKSCRVQDHTKTTHNIKKSLQHVRLLSYEMNLSIESCKRKMWHRLNKLLY